MKIVEQNAQTFMFGDGLARKRPPSGLTKSTRPPGNRQTLNERREQQRKEEELRKAEEERLIAEEKKRKELEQQRVAAAVAAEERGKAEEIIRTSIGSSSRGNPLCMELVDYLIGIRLEKPKSQVEISEHVSRAHQYFGLSISRLGNFAKKSVENKKYDITANNHDELCGVVAKRDDPNLILVGEVPVHLSCLQNVRLKAARSLNLTRVPLSISVDQLSKSLKGEIQRKQIQISI